MIDTIEVVVVNNIVQACLVVIWNVSHHEPQRLDNAALTFAKPFHCKVGENFHCNNVSLGWVLLRHIAPVD